MMHIVIKKGVIPMITTLTNKAISYLGVKEPTGDDQFIKYYNNITRAGFNMNVAWCAIFVTVVARRVGVSTSIVPTFANCDVGVRWFKSKGRYEKSIAYGGTYKPKKGDVIFYSSKYTQADSTHVGYIVSVTDSMMKAIEGNKANSVAYRTMSLSNRYITGYGRVADFLGGETAASTSSSASSAAVATVQKNIETANVAAYQRWLNKNYGKYIRKCKACGNKLLVVDNDYGAKTKAAATVAYQVQCNKKFDAGLVVDGEFGRKSKAYGNRALVKKGKKGKFVYIVQGMMCAKGCYPGELDGIAGSILQAGIKTYQGMNGLERDGKCGAETYTHILG